MWKKYKEFQGLPIGFKPRPSIKVQRDWYNNAKSWKRNCSLAEDS